MATTRNIQMQYYNGTDYDMLYPESTINQIQNLQSNLNNLQNNIDSKLSLSGGTMTGPLYLYANPSASNESANKNYVDTIKNQIDLTKLGGTEIYSGIFEFSLNNQNRSQQSNFNINLEEDWLFLMVDVNISYNGLGLQQSDGTNLQIYNIYNVDFGDITVDNLTMRYLYYRKDERGYYSFSQISYQVKQWVNNNHTIADKIINDNMPVTYYYSASLEDNYMGSIATGTIKLTITGYK